MAHGQKREKERTIVQHVTFSVNQDIAEPPPPNLVSKYETLQEWLVNMCNTEKPEKAISQYSFGLFISPNEYTLIMTGINNYRRGSSTRAIRIEFQPKDMYYVLPKKYSANLTRDQVYEKIVADLKDFTKTNTFQSSFLSKADKLVFESNGKVVWCKNQSF
jgi:hypothetical protein